MMRACVVCVSIAVAVAVFLSLMHVTVYITNYVQYMSLSVCVP